jgi:hypothetical protein
MRSWDASVFTRRRAADPRNKKPRRSAAFCNEESRRFKPKTPSRHPGESRDPAVSYAPKIKVKMDSRFHGNDDSRRIRQNFLLPEDFEQFSSSP